MRPYRVKFQPKSFKVQIKNLYAGKHGFIASLTQNQLWKSQRYNSHVNPWRERARRYWWQLRSSGSGHHAAPGKGIHTLYPAPAPPLPALVLCAHWRKAK